MLQIITFFYKVIKTLSLYKTIELSWNQIQPKTNEIKYNRSDKFWYTEASYCLSEHPKAQDANNLCVFGLRVRFSLFSANIPRYLCSYIFKLSALLVFIHSDVSISFLLQVGTLTPFATSPSGPKLYIYAKM